MIEMSEEELQAKHRKERKELQALITNLKKSCTKGDKKKKKEITEEVARLEFELDQRQSKELEEFESRDNEIIQNGERMDDDDDVKDEDEVKESRVTKAQKRRNKKANEQRQREERINEQEKHNKNGPRNKEIEEINKALKELGLKIHNVPADGNCLYCAVGHQLEVTNRLTYDVSKLRVMTADYMRKNKDDFLPFMTHPDEDEIFTEDQYEEYCNILVKKPVWGGQIEIRALSNALKVPIKVIQANSAPTIQGEQFKGNPLVLAYHRHLYRLGEHYNSTISIDNE